MPSYSKNKKLIPVLLLQDGIQPGLERHLLLSPGRAGAEPEKG